MFTYWMVLERIETGITMNVFERARCLQRTKGPEVVKTTCEIYSVSVVFNLPDWTSHERFDEETPLHYPGGHAWEGQVERYVNHNIISEALFEIKVPDSDIEVVETCLMNGGYESVTVSFSCDIGVLPRQVKLFQAELEKFLNKIQKEH